MAVFFLSILSVAEMIIGGAIHFFGWPHRWLGVVLMVMGVLTGVLTWRVYEDERADWQLSVEQRRDLGNEIKSTIQHFPVLIFWNKSDVQSKNHADDLLNTFRVNGWKLAQRRSEADITRSVVGIKVVKSRADEIPPPNAVYLRNMLAKAGLELPERIETEDVMPKGHVGIQVGRQPKWSVEDLWHAVGF